MLSYRHGFHAGNHADVFKHVLLLALIEALSRKDKPLCYIDTHAGQGRYRLTPEASGGLCEYREGIERVAAAPAPPPLVERYLAFASAVPGQYPGSPLLAAQALRPADRLVLCELQAEEAALLAATTAEDRRIEVRRTCGYTALNALLPPAARRGLILIDPSYERQDEPEHILEALLAVRRRFATGVCAVWYPLAPQSGHARLARLIEGEFGEKLLHAAFTVRPADSPVGLNGSGLLVVNPPYGLAASITAVLPWLQAVLAQADGGGWSLTDSSG
jgi:23S rRNA (adenine2030-N6)-methyltransferase